MAGICYADFIVYYDKDTSEVQYIVEKKNEKKVQLSDEDKDRLKTKVFQGRVEDYDLTEAYDDYKLQGK